MVIAGLAYALNEIIDSYPASDDHSFGHQMKVTFTITGFIFGGPLLFHLVDRIPTLGKSDLSAASLRYTMISLFLSIPHISIFMNIYRVVRRNFQIGLSLFYFGLGSCTNFSQFVVDTHIPKPHVGVTEISNRPHSVQEINSSSR